MSKDASDTIRRRRNRVLYADKIYQQTAFDKGFKNYIILEGGLNTGKAAMTYIPHYIGMIEGARETTLEEQTNYSGNNPLDLPSEPRNITVIPGSTTITVYFLAPSSSGASPIINYQYSINNGSSFTTILTNPFTITGLTNGTIYQLRLRAVNKNGEGAASTAIHVAPIPAFNPILIGNINLWLNGHNTNSVLRVGNNVTNWNDTSGTENNFDFGGGIVTYTLTPGINNRPSLFFAVEDSYMDATFNMSPITNQMTLFVMFYQVQVGPGMSYIFWNSADNTFFNLFNDTTDSQWLDMFVGNNETTTVLERVGKVTLATVQLLEDGGDGTFDVFVNGEERIYDRTRNRTSLNQILDWRIGGGGMIGYIGEVITYSSVLSRYDRQSIEGYLAWKWGIQNDLALDHPYRTAPPPAN
jgi:hypothetical protein